MASGKSGLSVRVSGGDDAGGETDGKRRGAKRQNTLSHRDILLLNQWFTDHREAIESNGWSMEEVAKMVTDSIGVFVNVNNIMGFCKTIDYVWPVPPKPAYGMAAVHRKLSGMRRDLLFLTQTVVGLMEKLGETPDAEVRAILTRVETDDENEGG